MTASPLSDPAQLTRVVTQANATLCLSPSSPGALIVQGAFYSDLIGPGASVKLPSTFHCVTVYALGQVKFGVAKTLAARVLIYRRRAENIRTLQRLTNIAQDERRAELLVASLSQRFGLEPVMALPPEVVAQLVSVSDRHIRDSLATYHRHLTTVASAQRLSDPARLAWERRLHEVRPTIDISTRDISTADSPSPTADNLTADSPNSDNPNSDNLSSDFAAEADDVDSAAFESAAFTPSASLVPATPTCA